MVSLSLTLGGGKFQLKSCSLIDLIFALNIQQNCMTKVDNMLGNIESKRSAKASIAKIKYCSYVKVL